MLAPELESKSISILASRLPEALEAIEKLAKKARRYGCPDIKVTVGEGHRVTHYGKDWDGNEFAVKLDHVYLTVEGDAPRIGNHEFLAHIELTSSGNIVDVKPGVDDLDPRFRHSDGYCDHCRSARNRKDVFAVRDLDTGAQLQIGRNCLRDYLGIDNPASIAYRFAFWRQFNEWEEGFHGGRPEFCQSLQGVLSLTATCIRLFGWCSKGQAQYDESLKPTSQYVSEVLFPSPRDSADERALRQRILDEHNEIDDQTARDTIQWVREELNDGSEYGHNLKVLFGSDNIHDAKRLGICVSAVSSFLRAKERALRVTKERETAKTSQHVGQIGDRLRDVKLTLQFQRVVGSNDFGDCVLIKFVDDAGNLYSWFTSAGSGLNIGEQCLLTGTVKKHNIYEGIAETVLTRCKIKELP